MLSNWKLIAVYGILAVAEAAAIPNQEFTGLIETRQATKKTLKGKNFVCGSVTLTADDVGKAVATMKSLENGSIAKYPEPFMNKARVNNKEYSVFPGVTKALLEFPILVGEVFKGACIVFSTFCFMDRANLWIYLVIGPQSKAGLYRAVTDTKGNFVGVMYHISSTNFAKCESVAAPSQENGTA